MPRFNLKLLRTAQHVVHTSLEIPLGVVLWRPQYRRIYGVNLNSSASSPYCDSWFKTRRENVIQRTCLDKVRELIAVKVLHTSLLNTTVVAFKVLPLGSYAPMPALSPPFKTILELVLWNGLQSCRCITPDVISVIKMPSFQYFLYLRDQEKVIGRARSGE